MGKAKTIILVLFLYLVSVYADPVTRAPIHPTETQCRELYNHLLVVASQDENPLFPAIRAARKQLESIEILRAQIQQCRNSITMEDYYCQMKGQTYQEILNCTVSRPDTEKENQIVIERIDPQRVTVREVNEAECQKTYDHMVRVFSESSSFSNQKDRERLLSYWGTEAARQSFRRRCLNAFQTTDLSCILSARDTGIIQACLIQIPPE